MPNYKHGRKDKIHDDLCEDLRERGFLVIETHRMGRGWPDCLVARDIVALEFKTPKTAYGDKGANKGQVAWAKRFKEQGGRSYVVRTKVEARAAAGQVK